MLTRRKFSKLILGSTMLASSGLDLEAGQTTVPRAFTESSDQDYDLLIKGGTVIDPGQRLHAQLDVAVKGRKILAVAQDLPASRARQVFSAKDKIVTPGWIDL